MTEREIEECKKEIDELENSKNEKDDLGREE